MRRILLASVLVLVVGCSADPTPDDGALARSAVVTAADLGRGWRSLPPVADGSLHQACEGTDTHGRTGSADSRRFLRGRKAIEGEVSIWADERAAEAFLARVATDETTACIRRHLIRSGRRFYDYVDVRVEPAATVSYGDATVARRFHISSSTEDFSASSYVDAIVVRSGRTVAAFTFVQSGAPFERPRDSVVRPVLDRLGGRDALA